MKKTKRDKKLMLDTAKVRTLSESLTPEQMRAIAGGVGTISGGTTHTGVGGEPGGC